MSPTSTSKPARRVIMGIDPGTNVMGYGLLRVEGKRVEMMAMGVIDLRRCHDVYTKLGRIYERVAGLIDAFNPGELAIEAPFFGKNVQSMLKLGRAQGVAIAAAISRGLPIHEYAPLKIKQAITANGQADKAQVAGVLKRILHIGDDNAVPFLDATDALAAAYCHYLESGRPTMVSDGPRSWKDFVKQRSGTGNQPLTAPQMKLAKALCKKPS